VIPSLPESPKLPQHPPDDGFVRKEKNGAITIESETFAELLKAVTALLEKVKL
jgi:hypothetical protein